MISLKFEQLINKETKVSVIGLGYVGLPLAVAFSEKFEVIGFDIDTKKVNMYKEGIDPTKEVGDKVLSTTNMLFTNNESDLAGCLFHVITVPTPINGDKTPNLEPVESASRIVGRNLKKGSIVVYESTVYPGVTEDICIPIIEEESGMKFGIDFKVGYSPERINPGDKVNTLDKIIKVVSGSDEESLNIIDSVYSSVIKAGTHKVSSIKIAEASKVIENSQRDINIAFMNELSMVFNLMDINTYEVLEAASTKWNFLKFYPGLVGGHCIGVDPYYFTYKAEELGYHSQIILSGREINNEMPKFVVENVIKKLVKNKIDLNKARIGIFGITFKEDCPDIRNSKNIEIVELLRDYDIEIDVFDTEADSQEVLEVYGIETKEFSSSNKLDALIIAVPHNNAKQLIQEYIEINNKTIIFDLKNKFHNIPNKRWTL